jgi:HEAT repeat protein
VVPALTNALRDRSPYVRRKTAWALGWFGSAAFCPAVIEALEPLLDDRDEDVRRETALALRLIRPVTDPAVTLGEIGPAAAQAVPDLREALKDARPGYVREAPSADILGRIGSGAPAANAAESSDPPAAP